MSTPTTYTHPDVFSIGVRDGWADPETDPTRIDWPPRQARAAIPFTVVAGRPRNPCGPTSVRFGRNELGHWGEQLAADAFVTVRVDGRRLLLMVERADGHGWALPGGYVETDEDPADAAVRELLEETGLSVSGVGWRVSAPRYVPDPRASDESWMVTVLACVDLGVYVWDDLPAICGADDAARAAWVRADSYEVLLGYVATQFGGQVFEAHRGMLREALTAI